MTSLCTLAMSCTLLYGLKQSARAWMLVHKDLTVLGSRHKATLTASTSASCKRLSHQLRAVRQRHPILTVTHPNNCDRAVKVM